MPTGASSAALAWKVRSMLSPTGRTRARRLADRMLAPIGSIHGAAAPSRAVALTFDDGPDATVTPALLDLLAARGVRATFFVLTDRVLRHREIISRMAVEGHEIALHADRHSRLTLVPALELKRRICAARAVLRGVTGMPVRFFRPPFGAQSLTTYVVARLCGLEVVVWGPDARDWVESSPEEIAARALSHLTGGDILLLHDGLETPPGEPLPTFDRVRAFSLILDGMEARGLHPMTVGQLVDTGTTRWTAWFRP